MDPAESLRRAVAPGIDRDAHRAIARLDPADLDALGVVPGGPVWIEGERRALARAMPSRMQDRGAGLVQMGETLQRNARASPGDAATVRRAEVTPATRVKLAPLGEDLGERDLGALGPALHGAPVRAGDVLSVSLFGAHVRSLEVVSTEPEGAVSIGPSAVLEVGSARAQAAPTEHAAGDAGPPMGYARIGGIGPQLKKIRETIELPLRYPEVFERLGIGAPQGILLYGPPGCGKTLTARTIAAACDASFHSVSGPEIIQKFYGESEAALRGVFERAQQQAPAIIFLDEIDSLAPRREDAAGDVERRVVATLLTLMDGMSSRERVVVIGATNRPNAIDPALRRPGRFDREIAIPVPDRRGRLEILEIHSRDMPLAPGVSLEHLGDATHGYVGADLEALCREAAMAAVRRALPSLDSGAAVRAEDLANLRVRAEDFLEALRQITPSATREVYVEVPDVRWEDVGGLGSTKDQLVEAVEWPLRYDDLFRVARVRPSRGILLCGPPGVGKTLLARAAATEIRANFISVKGPALMEKFVGESERNVREIFQKARQASPCIIFFDEIDALAPPRTSGASDGNVSSRVLAQLLTEIDGVEELEGVLVLAATNRPDMIDSALLRPGRFDEIIEISAPDERDRAEIYAVHLSDKPLAEDVDVDALARQSDGLVGSEIAEVCRRAAIQAMRGLITATKNGEEVDPARLVVSRFQLLRAIEDVRSRLDHAR